jgi:hypothetical protein
MEVSMFQTVQHGPAGSNLVQEKWRIWYDSSIKNMNPPRMDSPEIHTTKTCRPRALNFDPYPRCCWKFVWIYEKTYDFRIEKRREEDP